MKSRLILTAIVASGLLLGLVPGAQAAVRVGKNFRLLSDTNAFRAKDQVGLAVNPNNPQHIVQTNANYHTENCEGTASFDGGETWSAGVPLVPPAPGAGEEPFLPSCRISNHLGETMFQTVAFGTGDNVYATSIAPRACPTCGAGSNGESGSYVLVYKSTDGGRNWAPGRIAIVGGPVSNTGPYHELPTIAVEPGAGTGGADRVYAVARETTAAREAGGDVATAVSIDGGLTFPPAPVYADPPGENVAGPDSASNPVIGSDGSVYVAWRQAGTAGNVKVARSTNQGASWGTPVITTNVTAGGHPTTSHVLPQPATGSTFPRLAIHRTGNAATDRLYLVYNQGTPPGPTNCTPSCYTGADHFIHDDTDVYFQRSLTNGAQWSTPKVINDPTPRPGALTTQTRHPSISVAPNGRVDIVWQDRRHWYQGPGERNCVHTHLACDDARLGDTYYAYSNDGGGAFSPSRRITDRSHNNDVGFDYRFGSYWAFGPVSVPLGNDQLLVGWMDSREGNFDNDNHDIYLAKVNHNAPAAAAQEEVTPPEDPSTLSASLGALGYPGGGEGIMGGNFINRNGTRVVIVNQDDYPLALAAGVLARANLSPVLLSPPEGLPASVKAEVARLNPAGAYVIGDESRLSAQVVQDLVAAGVPNEADPTSRNQIVRLSAGADDAGTARLIASPPGIQHALDRRSDAEKAANTPPAFDAAVIVNPASPDAAAASALAAARRLPILFVTADSIPPATAAALTEFDINKTLVIGGNQVISNAVMNQLPNPTRLGGTDQYETSKQVVIESVQRGMPSNIAYAADGSSPMDGALLGPVVGRATGVLVLAPEGSGTRAESILGGLSLTGGLDRVIALRPTPGGGGTPPIGPPGGGPTPGGTTPSIPGAPPSAETDPTLLLQLGGRSTQRLPVITVTAETNKDAVLQASGTVAAPRTATRRGAPRPKGRKAKTYRLRALRTNTSARKSVTLRFRVPRKAVRAIKARLRSGRRGTARIRVVATDRAGNRRTGTRTVRIKR